MSGEANSRSRYSACARQGVHYVDITGETTYIRALIAQLDLLASKTHATLVPSCGVESLPADVVALLSARTLQQHASSSSSSPTRAARSHTQYIFRGGISGGSAATGLAILAQSAPERAAAADPCVLSPFRDASAAVDDTTGGGGGEALSSFVRSLGVRSLPAVRPRTYGVVLPIISPHNTAVVQRTRGLLALRSRAVAAAHVSKEEEGDALPLFADTFSYGESARVAGTGTFIGACAVGAAIVLVSMSLWLLPPLRWILERFVAVSGRGPSDECVPVFC